MGRYGSKYGNQKITIDNITFDSTGEGLRYKELKLLEKTGQITDLQLTQCCCFFIPLARKMQKILETAKNQVKVLKQGIKKYLKPIAVFHKFCLFINMLMYRLITVPKLGCYLD